MLQLFQRLQNLCLDQIVILDFQFLAENTWNSREKDKIVIGNIISTLN